MNKADKKIDDIASYVKSLVDSHPDQTGLLLYLLNNIQNTYRYIPEEAISSIEEETGIKAENIKQWCRFFSSLSLDPVGEYIIDVCDGTACHALGAHRLIKEFENCLGIKCGETTSDGLITLRTVNCVGACGIAPVVMVGETAYGHVRVTNVSDLVRQTTKSSEK